MTLVILFAMGILSSSAQTADQKVRALFIFKFVDNVSWPGEKKALVIGVINNDAIYKEIESRLQQKNPGGIVVRKITPDQVASCDVVYLPASESKLIAQVSSNCHGKEVLIISESDLSRKGSGISFIEEGGRLHFLINRNSLESRGLKVSNTLLSLGRQV